MSNYVKKALWDLTSKLIEGLTKMMPNTTKIFSYKGNYDNPAKIAVFRIHNPAWDGLVDDPDTLFHTEYQQSADVTAQQVENGFNEVYKQAVFKGKVIHLATLDVSFDLNSDGLISDTGSTQGNTADTEYKVIIDAINQYLAAHPLITPEKIMILTGDSTDVNMGGVTTPGEKFAWIFHGNANTAVTRTIPHEYGHAKFEFADNPYKDGSGSFGSSFDDNSYRSDPRWDGDNLMSYGTKEKLRYWQWEIINPQNQ